ncbi:MAG: hypothetical protein ACK559_21670, partial [bacterium]
MRGALLHQGPAQDRPRTRLVAARVPVGRQRREVAGDGALVVPRDHEGADVQHLHPRAGRAPVAGVPHRQGDRGVAGEGGAQRAAQRLHSLQGGAGHVAAFQVQP